MPPKARANVRRPPRAEQTNRPAQEKIAAIGDEHAADDDTIGRIRKMQQQVDAGRHSEKSADQEDAEIAPIDRTPQRRNAQALDGDAADDHHVHHRNRTVDDVEQHRAAQRREGKPGDAGDGRRHEDRNECVGHAGNALRPEHRPLHDQKGDTRHGDDGHSDRAERAAVAEVQFSVLSQRFLHSRASCWRGGREPIVRLPYAFGRL
jgi:hypothetical protein